MSAKSYKPCHNGIKLVLGKDVLIWDNSEGKSDCKVYGCQPALEKDTYSIPKGTATLANVMNKTDPKGQTYKCDCGVHGPKSDPKLIVV
jgi:hypothetical protein